MEPTINTGFTLGNNSLIDHLFQKFNLFYNVCKCLNICFSRNPTNPQVIVHGNANSIWASNYNGARPLNVIVHGWKNNGNTPMNPQITSAFLAVQDCNVIVVDWRALADSAYTTAAAGVPNVGVHLGNFVTWLINTAGGNWNQVHFVGFSLGAHVVGNAGRQTGNRPARITGKCIFLGTQCLVFAGRTNYILRDFFIGIWYFVLRSTINSHFITMTLISNWFLYRSFQLNK